ncbi:MAG: radical SAM protein [Deltaproteobacteria bacterium]|nr:radical SAM protein [Deltaproteobacteria bacterium]
MPVTRIRAVLFEVETRCNLDCNYCYNAWKAVPDYPRGKLSTRKTIKMIRKMVQEAGADQVALTGGEPLLRDDLPDIAASLRLHKVQVSVLTNGMLMDDAWARDLLSTGVGLFQLTLISTQEAIHDAHCGKGAHKGIMKALEILRRFGAKVAITVVVTKQSVDELPELMRMMQGIKQQTFLLNRYNPGGRRVREGNFADLMLDRNETERMLRYAQEGARMYGMKPAVAVPIPPCVVDRKRYPQVRFAGCSAYTDNAYYTLDPLGNVRMCNHSPVILGNIMDSHFLDIANGPLCQEWVDVRPEFCVPCPGWIACKGGCRAVAQQAGNPLTTLDPYVAANVRPMKPPK